MILIVGLVVPLKNDKFTKQPYVYVFMFNMKLKEFGLKSPNITENNNTKTQNNMKRKIRLTEGDLHRIIRKCINEALNEGSAETVGDFVSDRAKWLNLPSKKQQLDSDWNDLRDHYPYGNGVDFDYQDSEEARENGEYPFGPIADRHYETPEDVKRWNERMKYNKQADSRRLHKKGSLNRAFDEDNNISEGKLHKIIRRCVNEELKSKRY